jgi:hypothetical protein
MDQSILFLRTLKKLKIVIISFDEVVVYLPHIGAGKKPVQKKKRDQLLRSAHYS